MLPAWLFIDVYQSVGWIDLWSDHASSPGRDGLAPGFMHLSGEVDAHARIPAKAFACDMTNRR
jgi:hypothetical protein